MSIDAFLAKVILANPELQKKGNQGRITFIFDYRKDYADRDPFFMYRLTIRNSKEVIVDANVQGNNSTETIKALESNCNTLFNRYLENKRAQLETYRRQMEELQAQISMVEKLPEKITLLNDIDYNFEEDS